jgi:hypothetical protein
MGKKSSPRKELSEEEKKIKVKRVFFNILYAISLYYFDFEFLKAL